MTLWTIKTAQKGQKSKLLASSLAKLLPHELLCNRRRRRFSCAMLRQRFVRGRFDVDVSLSPLETLSLLFILYLIIQSTRELIKMVKKWVRYVPRCWNNNNIERVKMRIHRWRLLFFVGIESFKERKNCFTAVSIFREQRATRGENRGKWKTRFPLWKSEIVSLLSQKRSTQCDDENLLRIFSSCWPNIWESWSLAFSKRACVDEFAVCLHHFSMATRSFLQWRIWCWR